VPTFLLVLGLSLVGGLGGLLVASGVLLIKEPARARLIPWLISYAVGALLGASMLEILPKALEQLAPPQVFATLLVGILLFFVLEKLVLWRHCHTGHDCEVHTSSAASLVIIGDAFHTFVDGALIAAAVLTSIPLGATTAIAVAAHEIPQEVGDFAILLRAGYSRGRAFTLNILSAAGGVLGALAMLVASQSIPQVIPYVLSYAAGSFLYVAMADLIPDLHRGGIEGGPFKQLLLIGAGIMTIVLL
jgi:zinc and cadmium transporter